MADPFSSILSLTRAAVERYDMLPAGASVAVGVSGGKDSLVLLVALARLREFFPTPFSLTAITLDPVFEGRQTDYSPVASLCEELRVPYIVRRTPAVGGGVRGAAGGQSLQPVRPDAPRCPSRGRQGGRLQFLSPWGTTKTTRRRPFS